MVFRRHGINRGLLKQGIYIHQRKKMGMKEKKRMTIKAKTLRKWIDGTQNIVSLITQARKYHIIKTSFS